MPGVLWFGDTFLANDWARLLLVLVAAVLLLSSPLIRERRTALLLCAGPAATLFFVWATRLYLAPRFVSYLLVPLFMLLATGTARLLQVHGLRPRAGVLVAMVTIAVAAAAFVGSASQLLRFPAEAWKEASTVIDASSSADAPVVAQVSRPEGLRYYLARPVRRLYPTEVVAAVCRADREIVYVTHAYEVQPVAVPCLGRSGVRFHRLSQHSYGGHVSLWVVPVSS